MSHEESKSKHSKRIQKKINYMLKQLRIRTAKLTGFRYNDVQNMHRYHKRSGLTCGSSHCISCGNPRKFFKEKTIQEKRFMQTEKWNYDDTCY